MPAQPEVAAPAKAGGRPLGELEDAAPAVLRVIKIETPEASVSGVFNLGGFFEASVTEPSQEKSRYDLLINREQVTNFRAKIPQGLKPRSFQGVFRRG